MIDELLFFFNQGYSVMNFQAISYYVNWSTILTNMKYCVMPQAAKSAYAVQRCIECREDFFSFSSLDCICPP